MFLNGLLGTAILHLAVGLFGAITNSICIRGFRKIGLVDSVTVCWFLQAIFDIIIVLFTISSSIVAFLDLDERHSKTQYPIKMRYVSHFFGTITRIFSESSFNITVFLAIQRCACVIRPLQFSRSFTRFKTYLIIMSIFSFHCIVYLILLSYYRIEKKSNPLTNSTHNALVVMSGRKFYSKLIFMMYGIGFTIANPLIVAVCTIFMARALNRSIHFREIANSSPKIKPRIRTKGLISWIDLDLQGTKTIQSNQKDLAKSCMVKDKKEIRLIVQVSLLSVIYLVCSLPRITMGITVAIEKQFAIRGQYNNVFIICYLIMITFENINCSLNFFVYYKYNRKFRHACL